MLTFLIICVACDHTDPVLTKAKVIGTCAAFELGTLVLGVGLGAWLA